MIRKSFDGVKVLGNGELTNEARGAGARVQCFAAKSKIESAGGRAEEIKPEETKPEETKSEPKE